LTTPRTLFPPLPPGSTLGIVAPAGPADAARVAAVPGLFAARGYRTKLFPACRARWPGVDYLSGDDAVRLADVHAALADPEIDALVALRGGYGCMRLLRGLDEALVRRADKPLVGYSDLTALHAAWAAQGAPALHAPMPASDLTQPGHEADRAAFFDAIAAGWKLGDVLSPTPELRGQVETSALQVPGVCEGRLIGGNLSLVTALLGTRWAWPAQGAVLFLEDVSEELYRVDRLLVQLELAGVLDAVAGFVLGSFSESESPLALLGRMLLRRGKPLLGGWPSGHGTPNRPLPLGLKVRLDAGAGTIELLG
jgi:muramoyltetrapeptide carboxypeptidase